MNHNNHANRKSLTRCLFCLIILLRYCVSFTIPPLSPQRPRKYVQTSSHQQPQPPLHRRKHGTTTTNNLLHAMAVNSNGPPISLKSAAVPLMDAGKALARTGELVIDWTSIATTTTTTTSKNNNNMYGGAFSAVGANLRNAGDNIAQAAASCRFKTAQELVLDEIREAAAAIQEGAGKCQQAVVEARADQKDALAVTIEKMIPHMTACSTALEMSGAALLQRRPLSVFGQNLIDAGQEIMSLSSLLRTMSSEENPEAATVANDAAQRCQYAATQMMLVGTNLCPVSMTSPNASPTSGKNWLKG